MRMLGIDLGEKRIGLALSDELGILASPLEIIECSTLEKNIDYITDLIKKRSVKKVVIGLPLDMKGIRGSQADNAQAFADELQKKLEIPVVCWDERLTSSQAERSLLEADVSRSGRKARTDMVAAALLLQSYLDSLRTREEFGR